MKRAAAIVLAAAVLSSCVAVTVEKRRPRRGPVKEVGYVDYGGGQVRYSAEGWAWAVASRRKTALRLMNGNCGPDLKPEITDEYSRSDADAAYNGEDIDASMKVGDEHFKIERYIHLAYECRPLNAPAVAVSTPAASGPTLVIPAVSTSSGAATVALSTGPVAVSLSTSAVAPSTISAPVALSTGSATAVPVSTGAALPSISSNTLAAPESPR